MAALNEIMLNVYKQFFGNAVDMTEGAKLTCESCNLITIWDYIRIRILLV